MLIGIENKDDLSCSEESPESTTFLTSSSKPEPISSHSDDCPDAILLLKNHVEARCVLKNHVEARCVLVINYLHRDSLDL